MIESPDSDEGDQVDESLKENASKKRKTLDNLPAFLFDPTLDSKKRSLMMETEMNEQLKIINDLRTLGASRATVGTEEKRLQELQALCYRYFRRDMIQKWKRPSMRRSMLKSTHRSQSFVVASPDHDDVDAEREVGTMETIFAVDNELGSSVHSSPKSGPSRSASLKIRIHDRVNQTQRVAFSDTMRQSSLPSADSEVTFPIDDWREEAEYCDRQILEVDGEQVELRKKSPNHPQKQEPNIDFELDIKVLVNSGKCVLHTKDLNDEKLNVTTGTKQHKRERSIGTDFGSPIPSRRNKDKSRLRYNASNAVLVDLTIFHIPGLDVKLHYDSKTLQSDDSSPRLSTCDSFTASSGVKRLGSKRASLFAAVTLQSVPEETIISPHILEFLEQTLEPIPFKTEISTNPVNIDLLQENYVQYASFPVDVIVYFHMQPSTFRFSCLPVSRVECMLQLPSLDIVFSSKRQDDDRFVDSDKTASGGLSVTGCLADFNVYIFHPYGGKKTGFKEAQFSPLADSERKDSLSINVEFVKFHLTRSRKMNFEHHGSFKKPGEQSRACIRFSTIVDIGSASFKYDMRRLTEILAFPRAWYRRRIVRRLFLGDLSVPQPSSGDVDASKVDNSDRGNDKEAKKTSLLSGNREKLRLSFENDVPSHAKLKDTTNSSSFDSNASPSDVNQKVAWETLVLFAFNFTKLNVQMNMGNVMGNVVRSLGILS